MSSINISTTTAGEETRQKFIEPSEKRGKETNEFFKEVASTRTKVQEIATLRQKAATFVYSFEAASGQVEDTYASWTKQIEPLRSEVKACQTAIRQYYEALPLLDPKKIITATKEIQELYHQTVLIRDDGDLIQILDSPKNREAHKLCRDTINDCETIFRSKELPPKKVAKLKSLFTATKEKIEGQRKGLETVKDHYVLEHANDFHYQAISFIKNTLTELTSDKDLPFYDFNVLLEALSDHSGKKPSDTSLEVLDAEQNTLFISNSRKISLRIELLFQQTNWWSPFGIYAREIRYTHVKPDIQKLENEVVPDLQYLQSEVEKKTNNVCQGNVAPGASFSSLPSESLFYKQKLASCRKALDTAYDALSKPVKNGDVHGPLFYVNALRAYASAIENNIDYLDQLTQPENRQVFQIQELVVTYLKKLTFTPKTASEVLESVTALFEAKKAITSLQAPKPMINDSVREFTIHVFHASDEIIQQVAKRMWEEWNTPSLAVNTNKEWCWQDIISQYNWEPTRNLAVQAYLLKEMVRWLYFSNEPTHSELDLILFNLENLAQYREVLEQFRSDPSFSEVYQLYKKSGRRDPLPEKEAALFSSIFFDLARTFSSGTSPISDIIPYARSCVGLQTYPFSKAHLKLVDMAKANLDRVQKKNRYPVLINPADCRLLDEYVHLKDMNSFSSLLFTNLAHAMWANEPQRTSVKKALHEYFSNLEQKDIGNFEIPHVQSLLADFVFTRCLQGEKEKLTDTEKLVFKFLLKNYVKEHVYQADLRAAHGLFVCEQLLSIECDDDLDLKQVVDETRGKDGFASWKQMLSIYNDFLEFKRRSQSTARFTPDEIKKMKDKITKVENMMTEPQIGNAYVTVARECFTYIDSNRPRELKPGPFEELASDDEDIELKVPNKNQ